VATLPNNGTPNTENIIEMFNSMEFRVKHLIMTDVNEFARRGNVRNKQVKALDEDTEWVLFTDSDMVYESGFFDELATRLQYVDKSAQAIYSVGRFSSDVAITDAMINELSYPCFIPETDETKKICNIPRRNCGAGYFQLVRKELLDGYYVKGARDRHLFVDGQKARSDIQFRKRFKLIKMNMIKEQWHLNHVRDNEAGKHLEIQR